MNRRRLYVSKREGGREPFQAAKLERSLLVGLNTCREDERLAKALVRALALHLQTWSSSVPPTTTYVFRCVQTALRETGLDNVAARLVEFRRWRAMMRRRLVVVARVDDETAIGEKWSKARLAAGLQRKHGLSDTVARIVSSEVERRLLALDYRRVSTVLIEELARSELHACGLSSETYAAPGALDAVAQPIEGQEHRI